MLISPTSGEERAGKIAEAATGFIYYVAYTGTTGSEVQVKYAALKEEIQKIQSRSHTPVVVGFGIKDRKDVKEVCSVADGAVVGSALIREIEKHRDKPDLVERVKAFILNLKS
jgi:tryptophan synthase alpha chain